jgi:hypothetical protein
MFAPLGLIKGFDDTWDFPETEVRPVCPQKLFLLPY